VEEVSECYHFKCLFVSLTWTVLFIEDCCTASKPLSLLVNPILRNVRGEFNPIGKVGCVLLQRSRPLYHNERYPEGVMLGTASHLTRGVMVMG
jgi:hypothetical protein